VFLIGYALLDSSMKGVSRTVPYVREINQFLREEILSCFKRFVFYWNYQTIKRMMTDGRQRRIKKAKKPYEVLFLEQLDRTRNIYHGQGPLSRPSGEPISEVILG
jgi:hypothetical protein